MHKKRKYQFVRTPTLHKKSSERTLEKWKIDTVRKAYAHFFLVERIHNAPQMMMNASMPQKSNMSI